MYRRRTDKIRETHLYKYTERKKDYRSAHIVKERLSKLTKRSNDNQWEEMNWFRRKTWIIVAWMREKSRAPLFPLCHWTALSFILSLCMSLCSFPPLFSPSISHLNGIRSRHLARHKREGERERWRKSAFPWQAHNYLCCVYLIVDMSRAPNRIECDNS